MLVTLSWRKLFCECHLKDIRVHSFPTRRSSDLRRDQEHAISKVCGSTRHLPLLRFLCKRTESDCGCWSGASLLRTDRKSTRLNSSHLGSSYAVFCLKKKKEKSPHQE